MRCYGSFPKRNRRRFSYRVQSSCSSCVPYALLLAAWGNPYVTRNEILLCLFSQVLKVARWSVDKLSVHFLKQNDASEGLIGPRKGYEG